MSYSLSDGSGGWIEIVGSSVELPDRIVSQAWVEGLSPEERSELGFVEITGPEAAPSGQRIASVTLEDINGAPVRVATYEVIPPPTLPTEVPMYKVRKLLITQGLLANVEAYLNGLPEPNKSLALVDWDYAPNLVVNSALALGAKAALGLTDETYEALVFAAAALP